MGNTPLVSVAIPCYNHEQYVQDCIRSVINQDYENIELIIIDDGSSDNSAKMIEELVPLCKERFVRFEYLHRRNKGLSATLNEAIVWCKGEYFSALASDDLMLSQKTTVLLKAIEGERHVAGVFSSCYRIDKSGNRLNTIRVTEGDISFEDIFLRRQNLLAPSQMFNTDYLKAVGGYKPELYIEDLYMWLALTEAGYKLKMIDSVLVEYRQHDTNSSINPLKMYEERIKLFNHFSNNPLYKKAMAVNCLVASSFLMPSSKAKALKLLFKSVGHYRKIVFNSLFWKSCIKIITPRSFVLWVRKLKGALSGRSKEAV